MPYQQIRSTGRSQGAEIGLLKALRDCILSKPTLAVNGVGELTFKTTGTLQYRIQGVNYTAAAASAVAITGAATSATQVCRFRIEVDAAGAYTAVQGPIVSSSAPAGEKISPPRTAGKATVGYFDVPVSFTPGTTALDVAGVVFVDGDEDMSLAALEA